MLRDRIPDPAPLQVRHWQTTSPIRAVGEGAGIGGVQTCAGGPADRLGN